MATLKRILASRANGAKSQGPSTELGKQRSARNATRHGLLSKTVVLADEDPAAFQALVTQHVDRFQPNGDIEHAAVEELAIIQWRLRRLRLIEKTLLDQSAAQSTATNPAARLAEAFANRAGGPSLTTIERYETKLTRMYQRALEHFFLIRELSPEPQIAEPAPAAEPVPAPAPKHVAIFPDRSARPAPENVPLSHRDIYNAAKTRRLL